MEKEPKFTIDNPQEGDDVAVGIMHLRSWKETYINPAKGVTEEVIDELRGNAATEEGNVFRRNTFEKAAKHPDKILYRVVHDRDGKVLGFLHGSKQDEYTELEGLYLLNQAKSLGIGGKLMEEFLAWADKDKPCYLQVFLANQHAQGFYERYGFKKTDKPLQLFKDKLEYIEMVRPAEEN